MENNLMDLHIHTTCSDGEKSPVSIYGMARVKRLSTFAITDHDSVLGAKQLEKMRIKDINFINGVELSVKCSFGQLHILGYDLDLNDEMFLDKIEELRLNSHYNLNLVLDSMHKLFPDICFNASDIDNIFKLSRPVNRVDLARLLVDKGFCSSTKEAFSKYLIKAHDQIRDQLKNLDVQQAIELIHSASGIPVLAHNCTLKLSKSELDDYVGELANMGLMGIEAYYSTFTPDKTNWSLYMAKQYNLLVSGGSDYHGPNVKSNIELATGINNNLKIKQLSLVDYVNKRRGL